MHDVLLNTINRTRMDLLMCHGVTLCEHIQIARYRQTMLADMNGVNK
mgnify:CR=1 FL=1